MTEWPAIASDVARSLLGEPSSASRTELRFGRRGSLSVDIRHGRWFDHEAAEGGGVLDLVRRERNCSTPEALDWLQSAGFLDEQRQSTPTRPYKPVTARTQAPASPDPRERMAQRLWDASEPVVAAPGRAYLAGRLAWPPDDVPGAPALPPSVRWLPAKSCPPRQRDAKWYGLPRSTTGALVFGWKRAGKTTAVSLLAVSATAERVTWFKAAVKIRTVGPKAGTTFEARSGPPDGPTHLCEGEIDSLALSLAPWTGPGQIVAGGGTAAMHRHPPPGTGPVLVYCDDDRGGRNAALDATEQIRAADREARIVWCGGDPADELADWLRERAAIRTAEGADTAAAQRTAWIALLKETTCTRD